MSATRRRFLISSAAAGIAGPTLAAGGAEQPPASKPYPVSGTQVPKMKFGKAEVGRLVCGTNQFYGYAHFNPILGGVM